MDPILTLLNTLNTLSPLAVIALLGLVIYMLIKSKAKNLFDMGDRVDAISNNHLSGLPEMEDTLRRIEGLLQNMNDNIIYIRARINGGSK